MSMLRTEDVGAFTFEPHQTDFLVTFPATIFVLLKMYINDIVA